MPQTGTFPQLVGTWKCPSQWDYYIRGREWSQLSFLAMSDDYIIIIKAQSILFAHA